MVDVKQLLELAVTRNAPVSLTLLSGNMARAHKSRLLAIDAGGLSVEGVPGQAAAIEAVVKEQQAVRVSFRHETNNVEFVTAALGFRRDFPLNQNVKTEALRLAIPTDVKVVQRRSNYRVSVVPDVDLTFNVWRIGERDDLFAKPAGTMSMNVDVRDFSTGGVGGVWKRRTTDPKTLASQQRLRIDAVHLDATLTIDARVRFLEAIPNTDNCRIGIQFSISDSSLQDRQKVTALNKLFSELQRMELRRKRLGA